MHCIADKVPILAINWRYILFCMNRPTTDRLKVAQNQIGFGVQCERVSRIICHLFVSISNECRLKVCLMKNRCVFSIFFFQYETLKRIDLIKNASAYDWEL